MDELIGSNRVVQKYLANHAEPESLDLPVSKHYEHAIVIPAFRESWPALRAVWAAQPRDALIILVINTPPLEDSPTIRFARELRRHCRKLDSIHGVELRNDGNHDLLTVDRYSPGQRIAANQGVGLARKIGADIALALMARGQINTPRISLTDGDVELPTGYLDRYPGLQDAALIYPFLHICEPLTRVACLLYEIRLYYYAAGLRWAGSPYGFTTVGSTIAVNPLHYARVRGVPRRNAGEDFYLLNKLAKVGRIRCPAGPTIRVQGRLSDRVPIGTGPGLRSILSLDDPLAGYGFYNPRIFPQLARFQTWLHALWDDQDAPPPPGTGAFCSTHRVLDTIGKRRQQIRTRRVFDQFIRDWFDGFRTLKFVHALRGQYEDVSVSAIQEAPFVSPSGDLQKMRDQLASRCIDP
ncbi:MAG: hypothetical protein O2780_00565 [Proteobacteria bacterium]|jgi:hypothetical protein|nr:hypothetical protein [Pseudomonadota bacterium]MDA1299852.1 hypothetical protein [Pseudomonadota bacterium]